MRKLTRRHIIRFVGRIFFILLLVHFGIRMINSYSMGYWFQLDKITENSIRKWNSSTTSNYDLITNDTVREIYDIFDAFYSPRTLNRLGDFEWGDSLYNDCDFLIIQSAIDYCVIPDSLYFDTINFVADSNNFIELGSLKETHPEDYYSLLQNLHYDFADSNSNKIVDFMPKTIYEADEVLYANKKQSKRLLRFLGKNRSGFGIQELLEFSDRLISKREFLSKYFVIKEGHWGGWHFTTHPYVYEIRLNSEFNSAEIYFRLIYQGGLARLNKIDDKWILVSSESTWIE